MWTARAESAAGRRADRAPACDRRGPPPGGTREHGALVSDRIALRLHAIGRPEAMTRLAPLLPGPGRRVKSPARPASGMVTCASASNRRRATPDRWAIVLRHGGDAWRPHGVDEGGNAHHGVPVAHYAGSPWSMPARSASWRMVGLEADPRPRGRSSAISHRGRSLLTLVDEATLRPEARRGPLLRGASPSTPPDGGGIGTVDRSERTGASWSMAASFAPPGTDLRHGRDRARAGDRILVGTWAVPPADASTSRRHGTGRRGPILRGLASRSVETLRSARTERRARCAKACLSAPERAAFVFRRVGVLGRGGAPQPARPLDLQAMAPRSPSAGRTADRWLRADGRARAGVCVRRNVGARGDAHPRRHDSDLRQQGRHRRRHARGRGRRGHGGGRGPRGRRAAGLRARRRHVVSRGFAHGASPGRERSARARRRHLGRRRPDLGRSPLVLPSERAGDGLRAERHDLVRRRRVDHGGRCRWRPGGRGARPHR
jgi:hypothetical protein